MNMRAVKINFGPDVPTVVQPERVQDVVVSIAANLAGYSWQPAGDVYRLHFIEGNHFLDAVRDCDIRNVLMDFDPGEHQVVRLCLQNLKAVEHSWRQWVDPNGGLEIWVDAR